MYYIKITDESGAIVCEDEVEVCLMSTVSKSSVQGSVFCQGSVLPCLAGAIVCAERFILDIMERDPDLVPFVERCRAYCDDAIFEDFEVTRNE